jgi:hypothetical protein
MGPDPACEKGKHAKDVVNEIHTIVKPTRTVVKIKGQADIVTG